VIRARGRDVAFIWCIAALLFGLVAILGTCEPDLVRAQTYYRPGGPAVRIADGGTSAHDAATARRNLGISTANIVGFRDSLSSLFYPAIQDPLLRVKDSQFWIKNVSDTTKKAQFSAASIPTGTTRTYTFPSGSGTFFMVNDLLTPGIAHFEGLFRTKDSDLFLLGAADTTKKTQFTVGSATSTTRTLTLPDTTGTLATLNKTQTFTVAQTFSPAADNTGVAVITPGGALQNAISVYSTDAGSLGSYIDPGGANFAPSYVLHDYGLTTGVTLIAKAATTSNKTYKVDNAIATNAEFIMTTGTQTMSGNKTFTGANVATNEQLEMNGADNTKSTFADFTDATKELTFYLGGLTTATTRKDSIPDANGTLTLRRSTRDMTGLTANVAATDLATTPTAAKYRISVYGVVTTVLGAAVTVTLGWTDAKQAQTAAVVFATPAGSYVSMNQPIQVASGSVTITTTGYTTGTYSLYTWVEGPF